jgi:hypothetical protein
MAPGETIMSETPSPWTAAYENAPSMLGDDESLTPKQRQGLADSAL